MKTIAQEITGGTYGDWPSKGLLPTANMSVKYTFLNRIGVINRAPTIHNSSITNSLAKLVYQIGTSVTLDFGAYVFDKVLKQAES